MGFLEELRERDLIAQVTFEDELEEHLRTGRRTAYVGFDPTADSLHVGHLLPIMTLARWQRAGHRVIALVGGGTAMVGDPTGKSEMRQMLERAEIERNTARFRQQLAHFLDLSTPAKGILLDNAAWISELQYLPFLREVGRHFSVNRMLSAECFQSRLEKGLSFLEFNYMLLQAYDFLHLFRAEGCTLQLGGNDQWSNILAGVDLIRRLSSEKAFCLTTPLLATSEGKKMGKTEKGAVWLDPDKTSPYDYFQFWRNIEDSLVGSCLRYFTFLPMAQVRHLESLEGSGINEAKKVLAFETTKLLHGEAAATSALEAAEALFAGAGNAGGEPTVAIPAAVFGEGMGVVDFLSAAGVFGSKGEIRRLIQQGGVAIGGKKVENVDERVALSTFAEDGSVLVRKGKKHYYRLRIS